MTPPKIVERVYFEFKAGDNELKIAVIIFVTPMSKVAIGLPLKPD